MFDPYSIGHVDTNAVEVVKVFNGRPGQLRSFRAVVTLQGAQHKVIFKPNVNGTWDQLIVDRLKHLFCLEPMHTASCTLNFCYPRDEQYVSDVPIQYFMFADKIPSRETLEDVEYSTVSREFRKEIYKIALFRYVVGVTKTTADHILIRAGVPMSISEITITGTAIPRPFIQKYIETDFDEVLMKEAMECIKLKFDHDSMRGIILGTRKPEREMKSKKPKYHLSSKARDIAIMIETRLDVVTTCDPEELRTILHLK